MWMEFKVPQVGEYFARVAEEEKSWIPENLA